MPSLVLNEEPRRLCNSIWSMHLRFRSLTTNRKLRESPIFRRQTRNGFAWPVTIFESVDRKHQALGRVPISLRARFVEDRNKRTRLAIVFPLIKTYPSFRIFDDSTLLLIISIDQVEIFYFFYYNKTVILQDRVSSSNLDPPRSRIYGSLSTENNSPYAMVGGVVFGPDRRVTIGLPWRPWWPWSFYRWWERGRKLKDRSNQQCESSINAAEEIEIDKERERHICIMLFHCCCCCCRSFFFFCTVHIKESLFCTVLDDRWWWSWWWLVVVVECDVKKNT